MQSKIEETKLLGKQESPEIGSFSDIEEGAAEAPPDANATLRKLLQEEAAQNIKAEEPLFDEENVRNQLAMGDPSTIEAKGEDEEDLYASKALLQDGEMPPLLQDEESAHNQAEEHATDTQEQPTLVDAPQQPVPKDTQEIPSPEDTQEQQEPADIQEQPADTQQQTVQTDVQEIPMSSDAQQQPVPMEIDEADENASSEDLEESIIKQEAAEMKPPEERPVDKYYYYRCRSCRQVLNNLKELVEHRTTQHNIPPPQAHLFANTDLEPGVSNPDYYCQSCDMHFNSRMLFRDHLENAHHMVLKPLPVTDADILFCSGKTSKVIDPDPNLFCEQCGKYMNNKYLHRYHLQRKHKIDVPPFRRKINHDITPDLDHPDLYCASCNHKYKQRAAFRAHCQKVHKIQLPKKIVNEGTPDVDDPNNHCKVCEHTFKTRQKYKKHCRSVHKMDDPALLPNLLKRVSPPKFYCQTCDMPLYKDNFYLRHLSFAHEVQVLSLHHDEDDLQHRTDIIELIHARKNELAQSELPENQSRLQTVSIKIESADPEAVPSKYLELPENQPRPQNLATNVESADTEASTIPAGYSEFTENKDATSSKPQNEPVNTPNEPMQLPPRAKRHAARFAAGRLTEIDNGTPADSGDSQAESDDYQPGFDQDDRLDSENEYQLDSDSDEMDLNE